MFLRQRTDAKSTSNKICKMWISVPGACSAPVPENLRFQILALVPGGVKTPRKHHACRSRRLPRGQDQVYSRGSPGVRFGRLFYEITARPRPPKSGPIRTICFLRKSTLKLTAFRILFSVKCIRIISFQVLQFFWHFCKVTRALPRRLPAPAAPPPRASPGGLPGLATFVSFWWFLSRPRARRR